MNLKFDGDIWYWRGPAPFYFVSIPDEHYADLKELLSRVTYGWGMIPVTARVGHTEFTTDMFHKDEKYVLPLKNAVRNQENLDEGDTITVHIEIKE